MDYYERAVNCVKNTVLPIHMQQFRECGCSLDEQYKKYGNTETFFAKVIEDKHIYEIGYPQCVCPKVQYKNVVEQANCECSRQSILYILKNLMPESNITVEIIETVLSGGEKCRFKVTVE